MAWTAGGSGLDADTVDGKHAADLLDKETYDSDNDGRVDVAATADVATNASDSNLLDGLVSSQFMRSDEDTSTTGGLAVGSNVTVAGNLEIDGNLSCQGCVDVTALADGALNAEKIADEPGIDFVRDQFFQIGPGPTGVINLHSVTISAPARGFVLVQANGHLEPDRSNWTSIGIGAAPTEFAAELWYRFETSSNIPRANPFTVSRVFEVEAGEHIFYLGALERNPNARVGITVSSLHALFFPTRY